MGGRGRGKRGGWTRESREGRRNGGIQSGRKGVGLGESRREGESLKETRRKGGNEGEEGMKQVGGKYSARKERDVQDE